MLARLIAGSDVLVENYRPGVLEAMGSGEARLRELRPDLVYANISGFGTTGPYRDRPVLRFYRAGDERLHDRDRPGGGGADARRTADRRSGRRAPGALGICAALVRRGRTGIGRHGRSLASTTG